MMTNEYWPFVLGQTDVWQIPKCATGIQKSANQKNKSLFNYLVVRVKLGSLISSFI